MSHGFNSTTLIVGNTYPVRNELKALGGKWDRIWRGWRVPSSVAAEAQRLVDGLGTPPSRTDDDDWEPCGYPGCRADFCDDCGGRHFRR